MGRGSSRAGRGAAIIEDGNGLLRDRESRYSKRKALRCAKQCDVLRSSQLVASYRREGVRDPAEYGEQFVAPDVPATLFSAVGHDTTVGLDHITGRRDWATSTGCTEQAMHGLLAVLTHCSTHACWASRCRGSRWPR